MNPPGSDASPRGAPHTMPTHKHTTILTYQHSNTPAQPHTSAATQQRSNTAAHQHSSTTTPAHHNTARPRTPHPESSFALAAVASSPPQQATAHSAGCCAPAVQHASPAGCRPAQRTGHRTAALHECTAPAGARPTRPDQMSIQRKPLQCCPQGAQGAAWYQPQAAAFPPTWRAAPPGA